MFVAFRLTKSLVEMVALAARLNVFAATTVAPLPMVHSPAVMVTDVEDARTTLAFTVTVPFEVMDVAVRDEVNMHTSVEIMASEPSPASVHAACAEFGQHAAAHSMAMPANPERIMSAVDLQGWALFGRERVPA